MLNEKRNEILDLSFNFALDIIELTRYLKMNKEFVISNQLLKSGTSIGANVSEAQAAQSTKDLIERSQGGKLTPNEYTGATFSISNLGMFDVDNFVAIILPPQAAMMAVGSVKPRPVVKDNEIVIEETMNITLSSDHRVVDGAEGAKFVGELKKVLESPLLLIL